MKLKVVSSFSPQGDQAQAIESLYQGIKKNHHYQTLKGITGSGKTYTMACLAEKVQRPTLIISHNKTLAAQLYREFREFFPNNAVEYFVSYYDYYQPEAYVPSRDLYIEKDASINAEIDRLRHSATSTLLSRQDVVIVATVSAIYGLGHPELYKSMSLRFTKGEQTQIRELASRLVAMQYQRNDEVLKRGCFRIQGDSMTLWPSHGEQVYHVQWDFDKIERIVLKDPLNLSFIADFEELVLFPAKHFVVPQAQLLEAIEKIEAELKVHYHSLVEQDRLLEARRIKTRTEDDLVMLREFGSCPGIENYSRYLTFREAEQKPYTLLDYFPKESLIFLDESHVLLGQLRAMYLGDKSRKDNLIRYGFRLPSAYDNRPLTYEEFKESVHQAVYVSATPGSAELENSTQVVLQELRPTGLLDPQVDLRPTTGQVDDFYQEVLRGKSNHQVTLATTLTKKMAEELSTYLQSLGLNVEYLHSEVEVFERVKIIGRLRKRELDVIVGINLLREGLDIPEVSLVAIFDADKIGFLRSKTALIQTMGRAARHSEGRVILYADTLTEAMQGAIKETQDRRKKQTSYNQEHNIVPMSVDKPYKDILLKEELEQEQKQELGELKKQFNVLIPKQRKALISALSKEMLVHSKNLEFEKAALLRDQIERLKEGL